MVIQVPKFEGWLLAALEDLVSAGLVERGALTEVIWHDDYPADAATLLRDALVEGVSAKNPPDAKRIISALNLQTVRNRSRSFDKFAREVIQCYELWAGAAGCAA